MVLVTLDTLTGSANLVYSVNLVVADLRSNRCPGGVPSTCRCRRHVGVGQRLYAAEMEAAGGPDEDAPDENEETRVAIPVRQVHGRDDVGHGRGSVEDRRRWPDRRAEVAVQESVQVREPSNDGVTLCCC